MTDRLLDPTAPERPRFLSEADCHELLHRLARLSAGGGYAAIEVWSTWTGNIRWARNQVSTGGEVRNDFVRVIRNINGADNRWLLINDTSDRALLAAARRAERMATLRDEEPQAALYARYVEEHMPMPPLFFDATYQLDAERRTSAVQQLVQSATAAAMLSSGYIEVGAHSMAVLDTLGHIHYIPYTTAQCSMTVRDPKGASSGWAGKDEPDWSQIDTQQLSALAVEKCLKSRNPVIVEPGRYTTILEPQAIGDFVGEMIRSGVLGKGQPNAANTPTSGPFGSHPPAWKALIGQKVVDERISIEANPLDPELGFPPFNPTTAAELDLMGLNLDYEVYHPATWIKDGVLTNLSYRYEIARGLQGENQGLPNSGAFRMRATGETTSVEEMIATTKRGLLVTRLNNVLLLDWQSTLCRGYTRDGLWFIENGVISKPVKNMVFTESVLFALNNIEQLGSSQRTFYPKKDWISEIPQPIFVPALKIRDFSFTSLADSV